MSTKYTTYCYNLSLFFLIISTPYGNTLRKSFLFIMRTCQIRMLQWTKKAHHVIITFEYQLCITNLYLFLDRGIRIHSLSLSFLSFCLFITSFALKCKFSNLRICIAHSKLWNIMILHAVHLIQIIMPTNSINILRVQCHKGLY